MQRLNWHDKEKKEKIKLDTVANFHQLSEILGDDLYRVAAVIRVYHPHPLYFCDILCDCENSSSKRLEKYSETIDEILNLKLSAIFEAAKNIKFPNESAYIKYLCGLLDSNRIEYAKYVRYGSAE